MSTSMTGARDNRQSVQFFDVDLFRNKLENYMRRQVEESYEPINNKKRKLSDRWSDEDKAEMELAEDSRDDFVYSFGKRSRGNSYYPLDDDEIEVEEVSPLALPSPVSISESNTAAWPFIDTRISQSLDDNDDEKISMSMSMAMRRQLSGYSEVNPATNGAYPYNYTYTYTSDQELENENENQHDDDEEETWMAMSSSASPCPPLSRASLSHASSYSYSYSSAPQTPNRSSSLAATNDIAFDLADEQLMADLSMTKCEHGLDLGAMAPHERNLLAALAPERYEKAALIKRAFRQSEKILDRFAKEEGAAHGRGEVEVRMDDGEYDQVFGELMHV